MDLVELANIAVRPRRTITDVVARLDDISTSIVRGDTTTENNGLAAFTSLYRNITHAVDQDVSADLFASGEFLTRLDLAFAERFFDALSAYCTDHDTAPRCWRIVFDAHSENAVHALNAATAGVNAHINYDLAAALVITWSGMPEPVDPVAHRADYQRVNGIFRVHMDELRAFYHSPLSSGPDGSWYDDLANIEGDHMVRIVRRLAWDRAIEWWPHHDDRDYLHTRGERLDLFVAGLGFAALHTPLLPF